MYKIGENKMVLGVVKKKYLLVDVRVHAEIGSPLFFGSVYVEASAYTEIISL